MTFPDPPQVPQPPMVNATMPKSKVEGKMVHKRQDQTYAVDITSHHLQRLNNYLSTTKMNKIEEGVWGYSVQSDYLYIKVDQKLFVKTESQNEELSEDISAILTEIRNILSND